MKLSLMLIFARCACLKFYSDERFPQRCEHGCFGHTSSHSFRDTYHP